MRAIFIILFILSGITQATAFDTLHNFNHQHEQNDSGHWYDPITNFFGQKKPDTKNRDIIIINKDRTITINGHILKLMDPVEKWFKILGKPDRKGQFNDVYIWDSKGLSITFERGIKEEKVHSFTAQFRTYYETFPSDKLLGKRDDQGNFSSDYFKGVIKLEDGYLAREVTRDEFRKSEVWKKFKRRAFPNSYSSTYEDEKAIQFNVIYFTPEGKTKTFGLYSSL